MKKKISSLSAFYILIGLILILSQFYSIGSEIYIITSSNALFEEERAEIIFLQEKKREKEQIRKIRSTPEYQDRFRKENYDIYREDEIVLVLPPLAEKSNPYDSLSPLEMQWEIKKKKPIYQQWRDIFFKK